MYRSSALAALDDRAEVNLTPMLDVVFILLIFFIVTAVFVREQGLPVNPADQPPDAITDPNVRPIVVDVLPSRRLLVGGKDVDERLIEAQLTRLHAQNPDAPVVLRPRADAATEMVVKVMDSARLAGIYDIKFSAN